MSIFNFCLLVQIFAFFQNSNGLTEKEKQYIVDVHNDYRMKVSPKASNMPKLEWDPEVEAVAANWASLCPTGHNNNRNEYGENLAFSSLPYTGNQDNLFKTGLKAWHDEVKDYDYRQLGQCQGVCGHYTQMVDARSTKIGCATNYRECPGSFAYILVCNYSPAGNFIGTKPYKKGKWCTKCPDDAKFCDGKLCTKCETGDCKCKRKCKKGDLDKKTCTCKCKKEKGFYGTFCTEKCENKKECVDNRYDTYPDENVCIDEYFTNICPLKCHPDCAYYKEKKG